MIQNNFCFFVSTFLEKRVRARTDSVTPLYTVQRGGSVTNLQEDILRVSQWANVNNMILHESNSSSSAINSTGLLFSPACPSQLSTLPTSPQAVLPYILQTTCVTLELPSRRTVLGLFTSRRSSVRLHRSQGGFSVCSGIGVQG